MRKQSALSLPEWVPAEVQRYLEHTESGCSIRQLARDLNCHPSTVLRQVRRVENRRDDPLIDRVLSELATEFFHQASKGKDWLSEAKEEVEARSLEVLARLCQTGSVLAVAEGMEKAVVVREGRAETSKLVVEQGGAGILALLGWISCTRPGRLRRYHITPSGRATYSRLMASRENLARAELEQGFGEPASPFRPALLPRQKERRMRYGLGETPLDMLGRLLDKSGEPFLPKELVEAGKRLREDFELAQVGEHLAQNEAYFSGADSCGRPMPAPENPASSAAKKRAAEALTTLGSGLSDIALRCCCHLEGLETAERQLGWSARSGKIVLRIALSQLKSFYEQMDKKGEEGRKSQMIG
ncbi:DUF6456 domain-containing protein [Pseudophaeobacter sp.]|uniref:DUF6456 domain-containing protein n=1 Tax=Pseudophaeobacter sp. TaxID=1971739 RepID=UPI003297B893